MSRDIAHDRNRTGEDSPPAAEDKFFYRFEASDGASARFVVTAHLFIDEEGKVIGMNFDHQKGAEPAIVAKAVILAALRRQPVREIGNYLTAESAKNARETR